MRDMLRVPAPTSATSMVQIHLFGSPRLHAHGQAVTLPRRQMRALLYRLAASLQPVAREQLCFLLWPDAPEATARRYLSVLLNQLRQALPEPHLVVVQHDAVLLDGAFVAVDTTSLSRAIHVAATQRTITPLTEAITLYQGPFLDGFSLPASPEYDTWADSERQTWERRYLDALALLVDGYAAQKAYAQAIAAAHTALAVDELAEDMHRRVIELYGATGDRAGALRQFERCVAVLERELGVSPLPETRAAYEAVRDGQPTHITSHDVQHTTHGLFPETVLPSTRLVTVPAATTPLLGRTTELAHTSATLHDPTVRLLTLYGPGGSGKTRLAQQLAWDIADVFADGVIFVPLAALRDSAFVVQAIANLCGLKQPTIVALAEWLRPKHMLLVLDNCEHLLDAGPDIAALLHTAPQLHILTTSRAALNLYGEHTFHVPPLPLPDLAHLPQIDDLAAVPSIALLLARTQALNPRFRLTTENAAELAAICVRLDGLPLAIELAAARLKLLAPRDLLRRLDRRLAVLNTGPRDLPDRQQTLRATIDWSYQLLSFVEQVWFERCSVFAGGWTLTAAEHLHSQLGWPEQHTTDALQALAALVDKSLIHVSTTAEGETRFTMLETMREFAAERLHERGTFALVAEAHLAFYLNFIKRTERVGKQSPKWVTAISNDHDNLRAALRFCLDHDHGEQAIQLGLSLHDFWHWRDYEREASRWFEEIVARTPHIRSLNRARIVGYIGIMASVRGELPIAVKMYEQAIQLCAEFPLERLHATLRNALGVVLCRQGFYERAIVLLEEALAIVTKLDDRQSLGLVMATFAGVLADQGEQIERALSLYAQARALAQEFNQPLRESNVLSPMGNLLTLTGNYARAAEVLSEALRLQQKAQAAVGVAWTTQFLGTLAFLQGEYAHAHQLFRESLTTAAEYNSRNTLPLSLEGLAGIACVGGHAQHAARLLGAAAALREALHNKMPPLEQPHYERIRSSVQAQLSESILREAWEAGRALSLEQAIAEANAIPTA